MFFDELWELSLIPGHQLSPELGESRIPTLGLTKTSSRLAVERILCCFHTFRRRRSLHAHSTLLLYIDELMYTKGPSRLLSHCSRRKCLDIYTLLSKWYLNTLPSIDDNRHTAARENHAKVAKDDSRLIVPVHARLFKYNTCTIGPISAHCLLGRSRSFCSNESSRQLLHYNTRVVCAPHARYLRRIAY
ncbi:unnamed protein product [Trichogramma brassicae]|uniref:Uncharacterized protein n=1 Tax=Trichogramma brassicae TaxID=86971 RepID=A0A6H5IQ83_9HYME|nr:unnamed protein product [Trichogramma brassicae]